MAPVALEIKEATTKEIERGVVLNGLFCYVINKSRKKDCCSILLCTSIWEEKRRKITLAIKHKNEILEFSYKCF